MIRDSITQVNNAIYLDELTFPAAYGLLKTCKGHTVTVLEAIRPRQKLWLWLLNRNAINVVEASFSSGHLKTADGEAVYLAARRLSAQVAEAVARNIVRSEKFLTDLNERYGRNTIALFIAKRLRPHLEYSMKRLLVAQALANTARGQVWLKKPTLFDIRLLCEMFPSVEVRSYSGIEFVSIKLVKEWLYYLARNARLTVRGFKKYTGSFESTKASKPSVLSLQEDCLRADRSLRGQPHWVDANDPVPMFDTYVVELGGHSFSIASDIEQLSKAGVTILPADIFQVAASSRRNDKSLARVCRDRRATIWAAVRIREYVKSYFLLQVAFLLRQAQLIGALALWLNTKVFLISETNHPFADAMQLVAPDVNVITVAYQYSNMGFVATGMMSTADKYLIFSDMYRELYQTDYIMPKDFLATGYIFDGVADIVREKASKHRDSLNAAGARFVICYFDESVQNDRWGMVSRVDHLGELHALANAVLGDPEFGMVVKSQFSRNTPSQLYPTDDLIQAAMATGRYLELVAGTHRNNIYPTEAALVADLCIGHKFGATAALEAAIAGVRTVLLDTYGMKTLWDAVYAQANIQFKTMESLLGAISCYRSGAVEHQTIGDWRPILHYFDAYQDGMAVSRLRNVIQQMVGSSAHV